MSPRSIDTREVTRNPLRHALWVALGSAALSLVCSAVPAEEAPKQLVVHYEDLDLSSQEDAKKLYSRLKSASRYVCREFEGRELAKSKLRHKCYDEALANAVTSVNHAVLTALHADKNLRLAQGRPVSQPRS